MKKLITLLLFALPIMVSAQYEYLKVQNVDTWWHSTPLSIDTVVFEVKPRGLYAEVGMYFNFSTRGTTYFYQGDSLEIEMLFKLPETVEITDMWLWVYDSIVKAGMYDIWTANEIYEEIVDRRTDPALLYHYQNYSGLDNWDNYVPDAHIYEYYMFKIFPLMTDLPRKAKITYQIPISELNSNSPSIPLPTNILNLSAEQIQECKIKYFPSQEFGNISLAENSNQNFTQVGNYFETTLQFSQTYNNSLTLNFESNNTNDFYLGIWQDFVHNEQFYQFQISPQDIFSIPEKDKKAVVLFDFVDALSVMSANTVLTQFKSSLLNNFGANDSINIMFSGIVTNSISNGWIQADSSTISDLFNTIDASYFSPYSNLPTLLIDGINFIKDNGDNGTIVLISSSNSNGSEAQTNTLMSNLVTLIGNSNIAIHVLDLDNTYTVGENHNINNNYYRGNRYLYETLCAATGGMYYSLAEETSFNYMLEDVSEMLSDFFTTLSIDVSLEAGNTYSNYMLTENARLNFLQEPLKQTGKYNGSGRFKIIANGQLSSGEVYHNEFLVENQELYLLNDNSRDIWTGQWIREMYNELQTVPIITEIVDTSINERVLSNYTAFLALEPGVGPFPEGENPTSSVVEPENPDIASLDNYPNPFSGTTTISYNMPSDVHVVIEVYDLFGRKVASLINQEQQAGKYTLDFDATDLATGTYVCRMIIDNSEILTTKLSITR